MKSYKEIVSYLELLDKEHTFVNLFKVQQGYKNKVAFETIKENKKIKVTYKEYTNLALHKARAIKKQLKNVPVGNYVALKMPNSIDWAVNFWGLILAGYNPVLLDARLSKEEVEYAISQTKAKAICTNDTQKYSVLSILNVTSPKGFEIRPEEVATKVAFCTSGTTEMFKIFEYNEKAMFAQILNAKYLVDNGFGFTQGNKKKQVKNLGFLPFNHIFGFVAVFMWYTSLSATIVFPEEPTAESIQQACQKLKVTHIFMVPMFWNRIVAGLKQKLETGSDLEKKFVRRAIEKGYDIQNNSDPNSLKKAKANAKFVHKALLGSNIEYLVTGGGYISDDTLKTLNSLGYPFYNGYGMTEAGIACVETSNLLPERLKSFIGKPMPSCEFKISEEGELLLRGASTFSARIIDGVHHEHKLDEWYHTGDKVVCINGKYKIIGRMKELIIGQNGENINPNTLELKFDKLPNVKNYCIIGVEDKSKATEEVTLIIQPYKPIEKTESLILLDKINSINSNLLIQERVVNTYVLKGHENLFGVNKIPRLKVKKLFVEEPKSFYKLNSLAEDSIKEIPEELRQLSEEIKEIASGILAIPVYIIHDDSDFINDLGGDSFCYVSLLLAVEEKYQIKLNDDYYTKCTNLYDLVTLTNRSIQEKNKKKDY